MPTNLIDVEYEQTGGSTNTDELGMREMQRLAFEKRAAQFLLLKAPPASGKSRALQFLGLDKLYNQGLKQVIVAVPERSIAGSFADNPLTDFGFFADWEVRPEFNLCTPGGSDSKVQKFIEFLGSDAAVLLCTHATLRFAYDKIEPDQMNDRVLAIDEFHHVSADDSSQLGNVLRSIMADSTAHIIAMTGSYFRGDAVPVLEPSDEAKFEKVTYNYYQQLNGYEHMKSLGIGYHFYQGKYTSAIGEALDLDQKTIIHIPHPQSSESLKDKQGEVDAIIDVIGTFESTEEESGIHLVKRHDNGEILRIADLVDDESAPRRNKVLDYLRDVEEPEQVDMIIALGMAKEGFDWPFCEHALTVGYRGSLTEVIQIIGRATRDAEGKSHAQFTNLIAQPEADVAEVKVATNNMLKAITASLLMEQVVAPNFNFRTKNVGDDSPTPPNTLRVRGFKEPTTDRVRGIIADDLPDLKAKILQDPKMLKAMPGNVDPEVMNKILVPQVIRRIYPDLNETQVEEVRQHVVTDSVIKNGSFTDLDGKRFIRLPNKFENVENLNIDLIDSVNPFQQAFEILSKSVTEQVLHVIQNAIDGIRVEMTDEEAKILIPKAKRFAEEKGRKPNHRSGDAIERRLGEAILHIQRRAREEGAL